MDIPTIIAVGIGGIILIAGIIFYITNKPVFDMIIFFLLIYWITTTIMNMLKQKNKGRLSLIIDTFITTMVVIAGLLLLAVLLGSIVHLP